MNQDKMVLISHCHAAELQGIHLLLIAVMAVSIFFHIMEGAITIGCDNLTGIDRSNDDWLKVNQNRKHADLIQAI